MRNGFDITKWISTSAAIAVLTACGGSGASAAGQTDGGAGAPHASFAQGNNVAHAPRSWKTDLLIYNGTAAATDDPESIASIADQHGLTYKFANESDLDQMSLADLESFGSFAWPGGYAGVMSSSISPAARARVRQAVTEGGVSWIGFCAGAFIAVSPPPSDPQGAPDWGFSLFPAAVMPYYHLEDQGTDVAMVSSQWADGTKRDLLWWGGPVIPGFDGGVVARYADSGDPMITQAWAGQGWVVLVATHPESPQNWRDKNGVTDSDGLDQDLAWKLIDSALHRKALQAF